MCHRGCGFVEQWFAHNLGSQIPVTVGDVARRVAAGLICSTVSGNVVEEY